MNKKLLSIALLLFPIMALAAGKNVKANDKAVSFIGRTETLADGSEIRLGGNIPSHKIHRRKHSRHRLRDRHKLLQCHH